MSRRASSGYQVIHVQSNREIAFSANEKRAISKAEDLAALNFHANAQYKVRDTRNGRIVYIAPGAAKGGAK